MSKPAVTSIERYPNTILVRVQCPHLDEDHYWAMRSEVLAAGSESPDLPVTLDMSKVCFVPSLSLGGLIRLSQEFKARPQRLVLAGLQPPVRQTMALTRIDTVIEIVDGVSVMTGASSPG